MSEPINAQRKAASAAGQIPAVPERLATSGSAALRIDAPHVPEPSAADDAPVVAMISAEPTAGSTLSQHELERLQKQTSQIAEHLRKQYTEIDRREQRLHVQLAQLDGERRETRLWVERQEVHIQEREAAIASREAVTAQRADDCLKLETELKELQEALLRERHSLNEEREQYMQDREADLKSLAEQRTEQLRDLERRREDFQADQNEQREALKQERILQESRLRFQQDHLQRTMREFEIAQDEFRREQQLARQRREEADMLCLRRGNQLRQLRDMVEQRQGSVERERQVLLRERKALEDTLGREKERLNREREEWERERETLRSDLRRQQDMLSLHAENLESRRQRLDKLRVELEETNRNTLELRVAVEEAQAQLSQSAGVETARKRVDEARNLLVEFYRHTRDAWLQQRQELEQVCVRVQQQRDEFREERQHLAEWVAEQEERLRTRERELQELRHSLDSREETLRGVSRRWTDEKLEAESIIRDLLRQLEESQRAA